MKKASKEVAEKLQVAENAFVCYICRTRLVDGKPYVVEYTYMPTDFITGITFFSLTASSTSIVKIS